jgi:hypothetical protein
MTLALILVGLLAFLWGFAVGVNHAHRHDPLDGEDGQLPASSLRPLIVSGGPIHHDDRFAPEGRWPGGRPPYVH